MTSMTDITEPTRIREQLSASYERFTTVLEALDAAVSVAPINSEELLFANKLYRLWFGVQTDGHGHRGPGRHAGRTRNDEALDDVDPYAGLPIDSSPPADRQREIFVPHAGQMARSALALPELGRRPPRADGDRHRHHAAPRRRRAGRRADRTRPKLASRLITMGEMASSVAHELNQPLAAITNYCNGIDVAHQRASRSTEALIAALEKTSKQAQRAGQIIQRIQSFVKRSEPNRTPVDVANMVSEAVELAGIELRRRNVRLSHYVAARLPVVLVDPILIEQVLVNLLKQRGRIHRHRRAAHGATATSSCGCCPRSSKGTTPSNSR
jgi:signal transduction histidine kinase